MYAHTRVAAAQEAGRILTLQTGTINSDRTPWGSLSVPCCPCLSVAQVGLQLLASGALSASASWADGLVTLPLLLALSASNFCSNIPRVHDIDLLTADTSSAR